MQIELIYNKQTEICLTFIHFLTPLQAANSTEFANTDVGSWAYIMTTPRSMDRTTPNNRHTLSASSSLKLDEIDAISGTPNSVLANTDATTCISTAVKQAENDLTSQLKNDATSNHHITVLLNSIETGTMPKGLIPTIRLTAFKQSNELEIMIEAIMKEASIKCVKALIAHYKEVKHDSKLKAIKTEQSIKQKIDESSDSATWVQTWKTAKHNAETKSKQHAIQLNAKRNNKKTTSEMEDTEVTNTTNMSTTNCSHITFHVHSESTSQQSGPTRKVEEPPIQGRPLPERQRQMPRPNRLLRDNIRKKLKRKHIYKQKYANNRKHVCKLSNIKENIVNLSKHILTYHESLVLSKGLSFIPKSKSLDIEEIMWPNLRTEWH